MPVTPFHFGPAALAKTPSPGHFSFVAFGLTQIVIDAEPIYYMARGTWPIHRELHTYLGATAVALAVAFAGKPLCEWMLRTWNRCLSDAQHEWLGVEPRVPVSAAVIGSLFGGWSHVLLDSVMHSDVRPWWPLSDRNLLLHVLPVDGLHLLCAGLGALGGAILLVMLLRRRRPPSRSAT